MAHGVPACPPKREMLARSAIAESQTCGRGPGKADLSYTLDSAGAVFKLLMPKMQFGPINSESLEVALSH